MFTESVYQALCSLLVLSHLIFTITLWDRYYYPQLSDNGTEALGAMVTYLRSCQIANDQGNHSDSQRRQKKHNRAAARTRNLVLPTTARTVNVSYYCYDNPSTLNGFTIPPQTCKRFTFKDVYPSIIYSQLWKVGINPDA